jgi:hypothetical protein
MIAGGGNAIINPDVMEKVLHSEFALHQMAVNAN